MPKIFRIIPFVIMLTVISIFHFTNFIAIKYYPFTVDFIFFLIFFTSLFNKETIIQTFIKSFDSEIFSIEKEDYLRKLTYIWTFVTFMNSTIAFITIFSSERLWAFYNGFLSYILIGSVFSI